VRSFRTRGRSPQGPPARARARGVAERREGWKWMQGWEYIRFEDLFHSNLHSTNDSRLSIVEKILDEIIESSELEYDDELDESLEDSRF
jgi:hypothetical protein